MNAYMILDLQFGSTGKGSLAGYLATKNEPDVVVTAWGPNAGHTYIGPTGRKMVHRMLANGVVSSKLKYVLIGPGSVIDPATLLREVVECRDLLYGKTIVVHPQAAIVLAEHLETEKANVTIGSTMKGTGAAVIQRIQRNPDRLNNAANAFPPAIQEEIRSMGIGIEINSDCYSKAIDNAKTLQIEGAQGFSLSIYHGPYPYTTSRDVTPAQVMADCVIPFGIRPEIYGTLRTYPIRVANRFNDAGEQIGTSGPGYPDQAELEWEDVGVEPELTTVTKLPRRIFTFSFQQLEEALRMCNPDVIFLNFCNYLTKEDLTALVRDVDAVTGINIKWLGWGPNHNDIEEVEI